MRINPFKRITRRDRIEHAINRFIEQESVAVVSYEQMDLEIGENNER